MKFKSKIAFLGLGALVASGANAGLYVSPVVSNDVTFEKHLDPTGLGDDSIVVEEKVKSINGQSAFHGKFMMRESAEVDAPTMRYGQNVPLFVAMQEVVPDAKTWKINFDEGLEEVTVSWRGGSTWEHVLNVIASQNDMYVKVNHEEHAIGISRTSHIAKGLAKSSREVWRLEEGKTLRENLESWATSAGWSLQWDDKLKVDYPILHDAVIVGPFLGEGGAVDQLLSSTTRSVKPLTGEFFKLNNVLLITEAGFRQEIMR